MSIKTREILNRAIGILEGLNVSENISSAFGDMLASVCEMLECVLTGESKNEMQK